MEILLPCTKPSTLSHFLHDKMDPVLNDAKDNRHTSTLCLNRFVYVILITPQLNTHYISDEGTIVTKVHEKRNLTR